MSPPSPAPGAPRPKHRLVLCLDGTWNDRDDCTNVYHLANLVRDGEVLSGSERVVQRVHYQPGVGTGPLDKLTGGGFGFGLEEHVREAYDWLIEEYEPGDEIFVFGFSRGAYTARSLVGFISRCGLLERGSPLTVNQLWRGYGILGRSQEQRAGWWEELAGPVKLPFRALNELKLDGAKEAKDELVPEPNPTEELLIRHSHRRPIHFLGIFDTVGAVGWDALAIPGLRSKLALQHNLRATKLIERCCHALAIDENRSSFAHTPLIEYGDGNEPGWARKRADWEQRIEQRWFVGSHSSVGGGYDDNELALVPLEWMMGHAHAAGLELEALRPAPSPRGARPDSYADFAPPLWAHILRGKRHFRPIAPPAEVRGGRVRPVAFSLRSIHEEVDRSLETFAKQNPAYAPPALVAHAKELEERAENGEEVEDRDELPTLAQRFGTCTHRWLDGQPLGYLYLAAWATIAASGMFTLARIFALPAPVALFGALAAGWVLIDWSESRLGFSLALHPDRPRERALLDALFWLRAVGVVAFLAGTLALGGRLLELGWETRELKPLVAFLRDAWPIPLAASATVTALAYAVGRPRTQPAAPLLGLASLPALALLAWLAVLAGQLAALALQHEPCGIGTVQSFPPSATLAGGCLLLELAALALARGFDWVGTPLARVNLGSIVALQFTGRPSEVMERWRARLTLREGPEAERGPVPATPRVARALREALWRDSLGFIPLYSLVFALAGWFATRHLADPWGACAWLRVETLGLERWALLVAVTALLDLLENTLHLDHLRRFERGGAPAAPLVGLGLLCSTVKLVGFLLGVALLAGVLVLASWTVARDGVGWRATLALFGVYALVPVIVTWFASSVAAWIRARRRARSAPRTAT